MASKIYTTEELAKRFRCTPRCVTDWINHGCPTGDRRIKLPARKLGRRWFSTEEDVLLFEHRARPPSGGRPELDLEDG